MGSKTAPALMDAEQAARRLGITSATLYRWRKIGEGPTYIRVGHQIRYSVADLDAFVDAGRVQPEAKSA